MASDKIVTVTMTSAICASPLAGVLSLVAAAARAS
jgi:hypothetical protein